MGTPALDFLTESPECWVSNAELLIHYTTVAYRTLAFSELLVKTLQTDLPHAAIQYPYLLRQLMAFSSLHLAHVHKEKRQLYVLMASRQQDRAIKGVREGLAGPVDLENCHTLYAASIFLVLSKFASFAVDEPQHRHHACLTPIEGLLEIFTTISGMDGVFRPFQDHIRQGPLGGIFHRGPVGAQSTEVLCLQDRLGELKARVESEPLQLETTMIVVTAIDTLIAAAVLSNSESETRSRTELRATFLWPMLVQRRFLHMVQAEHSISLVILAYYSVLIHWSARRVWCFEGWARSVLDEIAEKLRGTPWAAWIHWPLHLLNIEST